MARVKLFNHKYGNYTEGNVPNIEELHRYFTDNEALKIYDKINISYNDGVFLTLTLNIDDDLIEKVNYLTLETPGPKDLYYFKEIMPEYINRIGTIKYSSVLGNLEAKKLEALNFLATTAKFKLVYSFWVIDSDGLEASFYFNVEYFKENVPNVRPYFVLSYQYNLKNQYILSCKLDSVLYELQAVKSATTNIQRAFLNENNELIYNNEGIEVTQIKQNEYPLDEVMTYIKYEYEVLPQQQPSGSHISIGPNLCEDFDSTNMNDMEIVEEIIKTLTQEQLQTCFDNNLQVRIQYKKYDAQCNIVSTGEEYCDVKKTQNFSLVDKHLNIGYYAVYMDDKLGSTQEDGDELIFDIDSKTKVQNDTYSDWEDTPFFFALNTPITSVKLLSSETFLWRANQYKNNRLYFSNNFGALYNLNITNALSASLSVIKYNVKFDLYYVNANAEIGSIGNYDTIHYKYLDREINFISASAWHYFGAVAEFGNADVSNMLSSMPYLVDGVIDPNDFLSAFQVPLATAQNNIRTAIKKLYPNVGYENDTDLLELDGMVVEVDGKLFELYVEQTSKIGYIFDDNNENLKIKGQSLITTNSENYLYFWRPENGLGNSLLNLVKPHLPNDIKNYLDGTKKNLYPMFFHIVEVKQYVLRSKEIGYAKQVGSFGGLAATNLLDNKVDEESYKLLIFPYGDIAVDNYIQDENTVKTVISYLLLKYNGGSADRIYDVQKIPYSSIDIKNYIKNSVINVDLSYVLTDFAGVANVYHFYKENEMYVLGDSDDEPQLIFFNANSHQRTFDIELGKLSKGDLKLELITKNALLTTQTYNTMKEYPYPKNDYGMNFRVNVDLKPITPYINVDIVAEDIGLYKYNFQDGRGLNIAEDLSITQVTDVFSSYKRANFNYLNSFNSQQEYEQSLLDLNQRNQLVQLDLQKRQKWESFGLDAALGLVQGTAIGGLLKGGVGLGIGAAKGVADAALNAAQLGLSQKQASETLALTQAQGRDTLALQQSQAREQFNYNIENIAKLPTRLDKVSGLTLIAKNYPMLITYETTNIEKERVREYLDNNAYNVNIIDQISNYLERSRNYIKGTIIRMNKPLNNIILQDINTRLTSGIYLHNEVFEERDIIIIKEE